MKRATINDAPAMLNMNDRAFWVLGFNAAAEQNAWKPIATAPMTGEHVLLATADGYIGVGFYDAEPDFPAQWIRFGSGIAEPTHWMPLPKHPEAADGVGAPSAEAPQQGNGGVER